LQLSITQKDGEIICLMGIDEQEGIKGTGKTVLESLMDFSSKIEAALHHNYYCSEDLIDQINRLNLSVEEYDHPEGN